MCKFLCQVVIASWLCYSHESSNEITEIKTSFRSELITTLSKIVHGHHNYDKCKKYAEKHERKHGKAPLSCKFKDYPEAISKLLEKIKL